MLLSDALTISLRHKENIISRYPCTPKLLSSTCILIYIDIEIAVKKKIHLSAADEEEFKFALGLLEAKFCSSQMPIISRLAPFFSRCSPEAAFIMYRCGENLWKQAKIKMNREPLCVVRPVFIQHIYDQWLLKWLSASLGLVIRKGKGRAGLRGEMNISRW